MMNQNTQIACPNCHSKIDVQNILSHQLEEKLRLEFESKIEVEKSTLQQQLSDFEKDREAFEKSKKEGERIFQERLEAKLIEEKRILEITLRKKIGEDEQERIALLQRELVDKSEKLKELNKTKAEIEILKREQIEIREQVEAEAQVTINKILSQEKEKIKLQEESKVELKIKELHKQLEDQKKLTEEMKRKQEQGSMQLQGEVQELAIEEWLISKFPLDTIEEIKKGARGGDCIQIVNSRASQNCGKIYYESKRTKDFQTTWIEKFKSDMREKSADIGVIVTEAMPAGFERMGMIEGIWICSYEEFKSLSLVLRESIIKLNQAVATQENKGDKMHMLYDFLTGNTFRLQVEAIVEGFTGMKSALDSEKRSMQRIWKEREKQIEKVIENTIDMYGSIKGIAGSAVQSVAALELNSGADLLE
ncbi:DUF2130 domain-containing protein [Belliella aquatica]|uniref:Caldesmon n=1 Tax=Belliella aquatica TaxID=1323734 RepID=A0ABQ1N2Y6_9BACT|nr:DUF2130 domain-containing protein [Belliella aquatica]MCH7407085.1 DUF2130 domain-containing protein [Belliella aquatica]GGC52299.1 hypothetical protein GCM10010993_33490 [Belliella aquatica]